MKSSAVIVAGLLSLLVIWAFGYLLIDVLAWIPISEDQARTENANAVRMFIGGVLLAPVLLVADWLVKRLVKIDEDGLQPERHDT